MANKVKCAVEWPAGPGSQCYPSYHSCKIEIFFDQSHTGFHICECGDRN